MDRTRWNECIQSLGWLCGRCQQGQLRQTGKNLLEQSTAETNLVQGEDWFEPEMAETRFAGLLVCDNPDCRDPVAIAGTLQRDYFQIDVSEYDIQENFRVQAITPAPAPFHISEKVPEAVKFKVIAAAGLFWSDLEAAANMVRQAVETLLDQQKVHKYPATGPRRAVSLHNRILDFQKKNPSAGDALLAVKWIGNAGSHKGGLDRDAVLDGFELLEHALEETYIGSRKALLAKAKKINARRKPLARPKSKSKTRWRD